MASIIYCLTNEAMQNFVKIGVTDNLQERMRTLYTTGLPFPFECLYAVEVEDGKKAEEFEQKLLEAFSKNRVNPKREFLEISRRQAIAAMGLIEGRNVTPQTDEENQIESTDAVAIQKYERRLPPFRFQYADVPIGAEIHFQDRADITANVATQTKISYGGEQISLSGATLKVREKLDLHSSERETSAYRGPDWWCYEGETLSERRERIEQEQADEE